MPDDDRLRYYLDRIREVAKLPDDQAIEGTAELLREFYEGSWSLESARAELDRVRQEAQGTLDMIRRKVPLNPWHSRQLRSDADQLATRWPEEIKKQFAGDINETRHLAYDAADQAEVTAATNVIEQCLTEPLINAQQVLRVFRDLAEAEEGLKHQNQLTSERAASLRAAKERAAWYRARRKLDEADVAVAGGNDRKALKLRAETTVLLKQDWHQVFPDTNPPTVPASDG